MTTHKRTIRFFVSILLIEIILVGAAILVFGDTDANAHTIKPAACDVAWQQAPPGEKWRTKQRCLAYVNRHNCVAHPRPVPGTVKVKGLRLLPGRDRRNSIDWRNQRKVVGWIVNEGLRRNLRYTVVLSALMATTQESSARELTYGHGTSLGPFQLIDSHGEARDRITVAFSGNWYYNGALKEWRRLGPMSPSALAQEVEESGHPSLYSQWQRESTRTLDAVLGPCHLRR